MKIKAQSCCWIKWSRFVLKWAIFMIRHNFTGGITFRFELSVIFWCQGNTTFWATFLIWKPHSYFILCYNSTISCKGSCILSSSKVFSTHWKLLPDINRAISSRSFMHCCMPVFLKKDDSAQSSSSHYFSLAWIIYVFYMTFWNAILIDLEWYSSSSWLAWLGSKNTVDRNLSRSFLFFFA